MCSVFVFAGTESLDPKEVDCKEDANMMDVKPVLACRACLAVERPLRPISHSLADTLASFVCNLMLESDVFPKYICSFCHALLAKFNAFKDKCQSVQDTLQHISFQDIPITLENIQLLADVSPYPDFKTATFVHAMPEDFNPTCTSTRKHNMHEDFNPTCTSTQKHNMHEDFNPTCTCTQKHNMHEDFNPTCTCTQKHNMHEDFNPTCTSTQKRNMHEDFNPTCTCTQKHNMHEDFNPTCTCTQKHNMHEDFNPTCTCTQKHNMHEDFNPTCTCTQKHNMHEDFNPTCTCTQKHNMHEDFNPTCTCTQKHNMHEDFNPTCTSTQKHSTLYTEVQCKSENDSIVVKKADDDVMIDDSQNDMILMIGNDNYHSDYDDSSDDGKFLINLVGSNREFDKKDNKHLNSRKFKNEHLESKIKSERKTKTKIKLIKSEINENGKTIKRTKNKKIKQKLSIRTDKAQIEMKYDVTIVPLSKSEQIKQIEARKDSLNYKRAIFKCDLCYHGFNVEATFKNHMAKHDPSRGDHECDICHLRYTHHWNLTHHRAIAHTTDFVCNSCGAIIKSTTAAQQHFNWHQGVKYDCKICGKKFNKPNSVQGHMHWAHGGNVQCSICNQMCLGQTGLLQHMAKMHKKAIGAVCASCGVQFHSITAMQRHRPHGDCDKSLRACAECGKCFISEQLLEEHKREHHSNQMFCVKCSAYFPDREKYLKHMRLHANPGGNRLGDIGSKRGTGCKNPAGTSRKLNIKIKPMKILPAANTSTDAGVKKSYICEICGSHKISKGTLRNHLMTHTGEKPYQCDYCDRRFIAKHTLQTHIHSHMVKCGKAVKAPLKEYYCRICNMMFNYQNNRYRHETTVHQQVRRYSCEMCGGTYKYSESLKQHINTKHLGIPWPKRDRRGPKRDRRATGLKRESAQTYSVTNS